MIEELTGIKVTKKERRVVKEMCNLSEGMIQLGIEQGLSKGMKPGKKQGIEIGEKRGEEQATIRMIANLMETTGLACYPIMEMLKIDIEKQEYYAKQVSLKN